MKPKFKFKEFASRTNPRPKTVRVFGRLLPCGFRVGQKVRTLRSWHGNGVTGVVIDKEHSNPEMFWMANVLLDGKPFGLKESCDHVNRYEVYED